MATITADDFQALINVTDAQISNVNTERVLDMAIDLLNLHSNEDFDIGNMGGTAGSKTLSVESKTKGAIYLVARAIYYSFFKGVIAVTTPVGVSSPDLLSNSVVLESVREAAKLLSDFDITIG